MSPERWQQVNYLFHSALDQPSETRTAYLNDVCRNDDSLRLEVESLLAAHEQTTDFIESPAFEIAPELLVNGGPGALVGERVGHYLIERLIGVGGMGEVYLARDIQLGRKVAVKFLPERLTTDEAQLKRFEVEARSASALNHPNILTVYEIGLDGNRHFIAMEFIEGVTLRASLADGRKNLSDALEITLQVASALAAAHEAGVVHRDIKPENIMLRPDGYVKVLDFGIAKLIEEPASADQTAVRQTRPGLVLGTGAYMSPEQARGQKVDARSDIWSLAVVLYEMIGGVSPFDGDTPSDCIASILTQEPPPLSGVLPDIPPKLEAILERALQKDAAQRYPTASEFLGDVRSLKGEIELGGPGGGGVIGRLTRRRRPRALVGLVMVILVIAALVYAFFFNARAPSPNQKSIAVLPFENLSEEKSSAYFADGIQDEILTRLSKIADLKVISRTSTERYKNKSQSLAEIAKQLGVANLLEGSVQKTNDQVRVNVQLIKASNDSHLWAETFDRRLTDIFSVETEIAKTIAGTLQAKLSGSEEHAISVKPTADPVAYQSYLKARYFWGRRNGDNLPKAIAYFEEAIARDPGYALAYAGLAEALIALPGYVPSKTQDVKPKAKQAALRSLQIDDTLAQAHNALGQILLFFDLDFTGAVREFQRAIALDPNYATAHQWYAVGALQALGKFDEAIAEGARAVELDPLSPIINMDQANNYIIAGRYDEAVNQIRKALELDPEFGSAHYNLGLALELKGDVPGAIGEFKRARELNGDDLSLGYLGNLYGKTGNVTEAEKILAELEQLTKTKSVSPYAFAVVQLGMGNKVEALRLLEKCYADRLEDIIYIKVDPLLEPLRDDSEFQDLVGRVFSGKSN